MKASATEKTIAGLEACGYKEVPSTSKKYRRFEKPEASWIMLVGKSGALRKMDAICGTVASSVSVSSSRAHHAFMYAGSLSLIAKEKLNPGVGMTAFQWFMEEGWKKGVA